MLGDAKAAVLKAEIREKLAAWRGAERVNTDPRTLTLHLRRLIDAGYLKKPSPRTGYALTPAGRSFYQTL
ncbi:MAG TPA: hypothetical protein VNH11_24750 [Pirellulales bacterium]|nr:hypothetical protein [Pirellulales bacterium]